MAVRTHDIACGRAFASGRGAARLRARLGAARR